MKVIWKSVLSGTLLVAWPALALPVRPDFADLRVRGFVGERLDACCSRQVSAVDARYLTDPFKCRTGRSDWRTEFWGKWMHSAVPLSRYAPEGRVEEKIESSLKILLSAQEQGGYLGNYAPEARCATGWDVWGMKYTMLGLLLEYDRSGNRAALSAAGKVCDYLAKTFGPGRRSLRQSGHFCGLPSCSVLEPVVGLYVRTKEPRYLAFARYVVAEMNDGPGSPRLIDDALADVDVAKRMLFRSGAELDECLRCRQRFHAREKGGRSLARTL